MVSLCCSVHELSWHKATKWSSCDALTFLLMFRDVSNGFWMCSGATSGLFCSLPWRVGGRTTLADHHSGGVYVQCMLQSIYLIGHGFSSLLLYLGHWRSSTHDDRDIDKALEYVLTSGKWGWFKKNNEMRECVWCENLLCTPNPLATEANVIRDFAWSHGRFGDHLCVGSKTSQEPSTVLCMRCPDSRGYGQKMMAAWSHNSDVEEWTSELQHSKADLWLLLLQWKPAAMGHGHSKLPLLWQTWY